MADRQTRGSNLYSIDFDALHSVLAEANAHLARKQEKLLAEINRTSLAQVPQDASIMLARKLKAAIRELREARLSDGAPFRRANEVIKAYFAELDRPLAKALESLQRHLSRGFDPQGQAQANPGGAMTIAVTRDGEPIIEARAGPASPGPAQIPSKWEVRSVDRNIVDLEELRALFTDRELRLACNRHLARHGPHGLGGVTYARLAVIG